MSPRLHVLVATAFVAVCPHVSAIVISDVGMAFSENFNTLSSSGTSSSLPAGWFLSESGTGAGVDDTYGAGTGSSNAGNTYSFGAAGSHERALGGLRSGTLLPLFGVQIQNATGGIIHALTIGYLGEHWRLGASGRADRLDVQFSVDATSLTGGTWADIDGLDFVAPTTTGTVGALNGNDAANRLALAASIGGLTVANGASIWLRWVDLDAAGADDGLGVDDFSVVASRTVAAPGAAVPESFPMAMGLGVMLLGLGVVRQSMSVRSGAA